MGKGHRFLAPLAVAAVVGWTGFTGVSVARADAFEGYRLVRPVTLPAGSAAFDALNDGRLIAVSGADIYLETAARSGAFDLHGTLPAADMAGFGAAFLRVSPDGQRLAVGNNGGAMGDNNQVGVFEVAGLTGLWFDAAHFDAEWVDDAFLALTAGDFIKPSIVTILDTTSPDPQSPDNVTVIDGIGGASGGIAFDAAGNLYTGNGFQFDGPSVTGTVKAFPEPDWTAAFASSTPIDFETEGSLVVEALSAWPLGFDHEGNLFIGGDGSSPDQSDFVGLARTTAVAAALTGGSPVDTSNPDEFRRLDPDPDNEFNFFTAAFNDATTELYVRDGAEDTAYVYVDVTAVPAASTWGLIVMSLATLNAGTVALGRRRRATATCMVAAETA